MNDTNGRCADAAGLPAVASARSRTTFSSGKDTATVESRLCPRCATRDEYSPVFIVEQNSVGIDAAVIAVVLSFRRLGMYTQYAMRPIT